jgi:hypothetical protein
MQLYAGMISVDRLGFLVYDSCRLAARTDMAGLRLGVAGQSFIVGLLIREFLGVGI